MPLRAVVNLIFCVIAAFEIAAELLRHPSLAEEAASLRLREHVDFLLLLAHFRSDMLKHSCRDIAAAAILTACRVKGAVAGQLAAVASPSALACAACMESICSSGLAMPTDEAQAAS